MSNSLTLDTVTVKTIVAPAGTTLQTGPLVVKGVLSTGSATLNGITVANAITGNAGSNATDTFNISRGNTHVALSTDSTRIGYGSGAFLLGSGNTAVGVGAGLGVGPAATGTNNVAVGESALAGLTTGSNNVGVGNGAADSITTGTYNVAVGYLSDAGAAVTSSVALGARSSAAHSNTVVIGNNAVSLAPGECVIGGQLPADALVIRETSTEHIIRTTAAPTTGPITLDQIRAGVVTAASAAALTELAFDTAANIVADAPGCTAGDSWEFIVVNTDVTPGQTLALRAGTGGTLYGNPDLDSTAAVVGPPTAAGGCCSKCRLVLTDVTPASENYTVYVL